MDRWRPATVPAGNTVKYLTGAACMNFFLTEHDERESTLENHKELEQFLADVERRAYRMAEIATGNPEDALDILQDAMYKLVQKYAARPAREWGPLFQTILQSRITDYYRRNSVRNRYFSWLSGTNDDEDREDPIQTAPDVNALSVEDGIDLDSSMDVLDGAIRQLPQRQRQAFMLRALEGLDVAETAGVMKCSQGSVKTHYFRALANLKKKLVDYKDDRE